MSDSNRHGHEKSVPRNPYASKKALPELFRRPLEDYDVFEDEKDSKIGAAGDTATNHAAHNTMNDNNAAAQGTTTETAPITPMSVSLPLWKRLPSNMISFGAAEILTVSEVCRHGLLYNNRSIRTTGVLRHRIYHPGGNANGASNSVVSLVLEDPLAKLSSSTRTAPKLGLQTPGATATSTAKKAKGRRISFGPTNNSTTKNINNNAPSTVKQAPRKPSLGMARSRSTPLVTPRSTATTTAAGTTSALKTPAKLPLRTPLQFRTPGGLSSRKRPLGSITKTPKKNASSHQEVLANALASNPATTIWIVVDPQHVPVENLAVGDLVTVFGSVQHILGDGHAETREEGPNLQATNGESTVPDPCVTSSFVRDVANLLQQQHAKKAAPSRNNDSNGHEYDNGEKRAPKIGIRYVQARILRPDNGANPSLHLEALKLRRKHLLIKTYNLQQQRTGTEDSKDAVASGLYAQNVPLQGCGPPPYELPSSQGHAGGDTASQH